MNTNETIRTNPQDDVIELGVASVETRGAGVPLNESIGRQTELGISD